MAGTFFSELSAPLASTVARFFGSPNARRIGATDGLRNCGMTSERLRRISPLLSAMRFRKDKNFGLFDGVWIAPGVALSVAIALRYCLIETAMVRGSSEGQQTKMAMIYEYLTGTRFRHRVQAIVEAFSYERESRGKRAIQKQWAKREEQIARVMEATVGMYGDLQGIAGKSIQEIEGLNSSR